MARPFGSLNSSRNPANGVAEFEGPRNFGSSRVFLVAIQGGAFPPILQERSPMERMRVVVVSANQASDFDSADPLPGGFRHALPIMPPGLPMPQERQPQARPVRGEILRGNEGRLYERIGEQIRPLHKLVSGSGGQVLELVSSRPRISENTVLADSTEPDAQSEKTWHGNLPYGARQRQQNRESNHAAPAAPPTAQNSQAASYRKFFTDPGQRRIIRLGDFKSLLTPQLAHPERVRDTHRLACYLQVYEATTTQHLESLAASVLGDAGRVSELQPVTELIAHQLGLTSLPRSRPRMPGNFPRKAGLLLPCERVIRLQLAQDPTADEPTITERPAVNFTMKDPLTSGYAQRPDAAPRPTLKNIIPERYIKPWELKLSRDEVLYDMNFTATFAGWFRSLNMRLKGWLSGRGELKKWQILLSGKSADDQLWTVRPPRGGVSHPAIRDWARKTLETAGYDPAAMLPEWEIFWRRKGL
jgi:hypothetical protein